MGIILVEGWMLPLLGECGVLDGGGCVIYTPFFLGVVLGDGVFTVEVGIDFINFKFRGFVIWEFCVSGCGRQKN